MTGSGAVLRLGPMLRHVDHHSATVFVETDRACTVGILGERTPTFHVAGHHYALVVIESLPAGATVEYDVTLDGERVWPPADVPPSVIRTLGRTEPTSVVFGSCRAIAPHDDRTLGVDALASLAGRMLGQDPSQWPHLLVMLGDQVYADDSSPSARRRIERRRHHDLPASIVADFEEYTWLYQEAWEGPTERWLFSVLPTAMIFDDHDMIDDWNISDEWVRRTRAQPWWPRHVIGGLVSYWIYQHIGNLSPAELRAQGMLEAVTGLDDAAPYLENWALSSEKFTPVPGGYRFTFDRWLDHGVHLVVMDARNGRVLAPAERAMLDDGEWAWVVEQSSQRCRHLLLASPLPVFVPGGVHGLQQWNEALCAGRWGRTAARWSERLRQGLDLEDWAAFDRSFRALADLLARLATPATGHEPPESITVLAGDIHFMYSAPVHVDGAVSDIRQVVCSPFRKALTRGDRTAIRAALSRPGRRLGAWLAARVGRGPTACSWDLEAGPFFGNNIGTLTFEDRTHRLELAQAHEADGTPCLQVVHTAGG